MVIQYSMDRIVRLGRSEYNTYLFKLPDYADGNTIFSGQDSQIRQI